ncbi:hypothetical protein PTKIN_Ptkin02bG0222600 [Pterospermum kingtungense]
MATVVLSTLLRGRVELRSGLVAFWTPFFLLHLGSSYNITAYSLEDNELWLRHFFGMVFQAGEAVYIYVMYADFAKNQSDLLDLKYMACPIFLAGLFKYGERIWALRCASDKQLVNSLYSASNTGADMSSKMIRTGLYDDNNRLREHIKTESETDGRLRFLHQAYSEFEVFKPLFSDLPFELSKHFRDDHMVYLKGKSEEEAFEMIGVELDFLYDLLFTKLPILHGRSHAASLILRLFSFFSCISMMIAFSIYCKSRDHHIPDVDLAITYLLLGQPIVLDICTYLLRSSRSNWVALKSHGHKFYSLSVSPKPRRIKTEMGIKEMAQHDLINYYVMHASRGWISQIIKVIDTSDLIQKFWYTNWRPVDLELRNRSILI